MKKLKLLFVFFSAALLCCSVFLSLSKEAFAFKLPDTGQSKCHDTSGAEIACAGTGQDGAYNHNPRSYTDYGNGTITDNVTGLIWQKEDDDKTRTWASAGAYCDSLTLGGQSDWRLPTRRELMSLVDYGIPAPGPAINTTYFPNTDAHYYWSSTNYAGSTSSAWTVQFYEGSVGSRVKSGSDYVRCVRDGQAVAALNNCAASVSTSLVVVVYIPIVAYSGANYWADLRYNSTTGQLTVAGAGAVSDASSYSSCTASTLSSDFQLHIPVLMLSGVSYWADFQYADSIFTLTDAGAN